VWNNFATANSHFAFCAQIKILQHRLGAAGIACCHEAVHMSNCEWEDVSHAVTKIQTLKCKTFLSPAHIVGCARMKTTVMLPPNANTPDSILQHRLGAAGSVAAAVNACWNHHAIMPSISTATPKMHAILLRFRSRVPLESPEFAKHLHVVHFCENHV